MSSWYRTLDSGIWGDEKFRQLSPTSPSGKYLWVYLLTGEHTDGLPGLYRLGEAALAEAIEWPLEDLKGVLAEIESLGMALVDRNARVIFLPNAIKYQSPQNPKHLQGLGKAFRRIPECSLKDKWLQQVIDFAAGRGEPYLEAMKEGFETVPDTVWDRVSPPTPPPHPKSKPTDSGPPTPDFPPAQEPAEPVPFAQIVGRLNDQSGKRYRHGTEATKRHIRARWQEGFRLEDFFRVIDSKCAEWGDGDMERYLRPQTLFGPKFESYANERASNPDGEESQYPDMDELMELTNES